jgi:hypothetical protein
MRSLRGSTAHRPPKGAPQQPILSGPPRRDLRGSTESVAREHSDIVRYEPPMANLLTDHTSRETRSVRSHSKVSDDASHGVRYLPARTALVIVDVSACLTDTFHSQGFSPSQRFDPTSTLWLCFKPLPPIGFGRPSELLPLDQPQGLSTLPCSPAVGPYSLSASSHPFRRLSPARCRAARQRPASLP